MDEGGTRESVLSRGPPPPRPPRRPGLWPRLVAPGTGLDHGTLAPPARRTRARGRFVREVHHERFRERTQRALREEAEAGPGHHHGGPGPGERPERSGLRGARGV